MKTLWENPTKPYYSQFEIHNLLSFTVQRQSTTMAVNDSTVIMLFTVGLKGLPVYIYVHIDIIIPIPFNVAIYFIFYLYTSFFTVL